MPEDNNARFKKNYELMTLKYKRVYVWVPKKGFRGHQSRLASLANKHGWHYRPRVKR